MKMVAIWLDDESVKILDKLKSLGINKSLIMRQAIKTHLESEYIKHLTEIIGEKNGQKD